MHAKNLCKGEWGDGHQKGEGEQCSPLTRAPTGPTRRPLTCGTSNSLVSSALDYGFSAFSADIWGLVLYCTTGVNIHILYSERQKYVKQRLIEPQGETDKAKIPVRDFHPLLSTLARTSSQNTSQVINDWNNPHRISPHPHRTAPSPTAAESTHSVK